MIKYILTPFFFFACGGFGYSQVTSENKRSFELGKTIELRSAVLQETRILNIYLPAGYLEKDSRAYPVIYLLDGSADEDFIHIAGLVQFLNFPWVNSLPPSIVVGIANIDRRRDFTYPTTIEKDKTDFPTTGKSELFITFLEKELQPYINKNYKTNADRTLVGQSLGGLLAAEILFKKPALFNKYIIVSPSLWWDNESLFRVSPHFLQPGFRDSLSVFVGVGKEGTRMIRAAKKLVGFLKQGPQKNIHVGFEYFTNENHASILHNAAYRGLGFVNKKEK